MVKKCSNFKSLEKMNDDIRILRNHQTIPRTWKDLNRNTMYWVSHLDI